MDEQIGRLRTHLRELQLEKNTILFFTSDNGPEGTAAEGRTQGLTKGLSGRKRSLKEGGIRVPGLVEWPGRLNQKVIDHYPAFTSDYFPTVASLIGVDIVKYQWSYDGIDLMPILDGEHAPTESTGITREQPMIFQLREQAALIYNRYKIYSDDQGVSFGLFDLEDDPAERVDLSDKEPEIKERLVKYWEAWKAGID